MSTRVAEAPVGNEELDERKERSKDADVFLGQLDQILFGL